MCLLWIWWRKMQGNCVSSVAVESRKRDSGKSAFAQSNCGADSKVPSRVSQDQNHWFRTRNVGWEDTWAVPPILWRWKGCRKRRIIVPSLQFSTARRWGIFCIHRSLGQLKNHGTELLPEKEAVYRHLRLLLSQRLKESIKDKAGPKKESCKTFAELIAAARYGEKKANSTRFSRRVVHQNFVSQTGLMETHKWNGFHRCAQQWPARLGKLTLNQEPTTYSGK